MIQKTFSALFLVLGLIMGGFFHMGFPGGISWIVLWRVGGGGGQGGSGIFQGGLFGGFFFLRCFVCFVLFFFF